MKITYMSDLHLEFGKIDKDQFTPADVLILAGDVDVWGKVGEKMFEWMQSLPFKYILFVPGNHEFYRNGNICKDYMDMFTGASKYSKVIFLWNEKVVIDGQAFIGSPLWSNFNNSGLVMKKSHLAINDFNKTVYNDDEPWTPQKMKEEFQKSFNYLSNSICHDSIVITHWAPSFRSGDVKFAGDLLNPYFTNNLEQFIEETKPKMWIHGHCHNSSDYMIGDTRILCNPRGYVDYDINSKFNINKTVIC